MAKPALNEKTIADYMKRNKCNRDEAIDLIKYDIAVEDGEDTEYDLTEEVKRERKPNELKEALVAALADYLENVCELDMVEGGLTYCGDVEITNKNRMIHFTCKDKEFDLQLIEKRAKKT